MDVWHVWSILRWHVDEWHVVYPKIICKQMTCVIYPPESKIKIAQLNSIVKEVIGWHSLKGKLHYWIKYNYHHSKA